MADIDPLMQKAILTGIADLMLIASSMLGAYAVVTALKHLLLFILYCVLITGCLLASGLARIGAERIKAH